MTRRVALLLLIASPLGAVPSKVCGGCHAEIYRAYRETPMAQTSGVVSSGESFETTASGFRIARDAAGLFYGFAVEGEQIRRPLDYTIGAGLTGRSYLTSVDGFLFQAPVSYYASTGGWDLSPGYEKGNRTNLTREVEPSCLNCHATGVRWRTGTVNGFEQPPFEEAGVSCERCHGPGQAHVAGMATAKPVKMPPMDRATVCAQCHLMGVATIGKTVFVWDGLAREATVNGHLEQLARSRCALSSGGRMWCGTCHQPHAAKPSADKSAYYRERCLQCHASLPCTVPAGRTGDCVGCHMPRTPARTVQHATLTDHTIRRVPVNTPVGDPPPDARLVAFGGQTPSDRDLGLAYASVALKDNNRIWGMRAIALLEHAPENDFKALTQLAQLLERAGKQERACSLYARAVELDPAPVAAAVNLGACYASHDRIDEGISLWRAALTRNPALESARMNLAVALYRRGAVDAAKIVIREGLRFDPASPRLRELK